MDDILAGIREQLFPKALEVTVYERQHTCTELYLSDSLLRPTALSTDVSLEPPVTGYSHQRVCDSLSSCIHLSSAQPSQPCLLLHLPAHPTLRAPGVGSCHGSYKIFRGAVGSTARYIPPCSSRSTNSQARKLPWMSANWRRPTYRS